MNYFKPSNYIIMLIAFVCLTLNMKGQTIELPTIDSSVYKFYAITTYDIYHKWINTKGEATEMETGGGGIIIVSLKNEQKIVHVKQFSEY